MFQPKQFSRVLSSVVAAPGEAPLGTPHTALLVLPESGSVYAFASSLDLEPDVPPPPPPSEPLQGAWMGNYVPVPDSIRGLMVSHAPPRPSAPTRPETELDSLVGEERIHALATVACIAWNQAIERLVAQQPMQQSRAPTPRARGPRSTARAERERDRTPTARSRSRTRTSTTLDARAARPPASVTSPPPPGSAPPAEPGFGTQRDPSPLGYASVEETVLHPGTVLPPVPTRSRARSSSRASLAAASDAPAPRETEEAPATIVPLLNTCEVRAPSSPSLHFFPSYALLLGA